MLNSIGIQNPGVEAWLAEVAPSLRTLNVDVWASAVGHTVDEFAEVADALDGEESVKAIEVNLACPNLEHEMFALNRDASAKVISEVRATTDKPIGAKLSPNSEDIVSVAAAVAEAGADWVVLTNTAWGFGLDLESRKPLLTGGVGGYSGPGLKPIALRCVWQVHQAMPELAIVGCGGVSNGSDVIEFIMAGASAVAIGSIHFAEPKAATRIAKETKRWLQKHGETDIRSVVGTAEPW
jgi:dihydroorotate dehydrogenase (NAD+) catalytic subunit